MSTFETRYRNSKDGFFREECLRRDLDLVDFISKSFCLPDKLVRRLAEEVADWRQDEHWLLRESKILHWARKPLETGDLNPYERLQLEDNLAKRERAYESRLIAHKVETRRIFGFHPRIWRKEIFAAARAMAANKKAEVSAQQENQHEVLARARSVINAALDELLNLGVSREEIEELRNG